MLANADSKIVYGFAHVTFLYIHMYIFLILSFYGCDCAFVINSCEHISWVSGSFFFTILITICVTLLCVCVTIRLLVIYWGIQSFVVAGLY